ncbi:MAG TPA: efflux RND transporter permease subunit, partial [Ferruginibacter sp.]|nr:efflux RND transporter permease subunit [Ferruginibacter sp.]
DIGHLRKRNLVVIVGGNIRFQEGPAQISREEGKRRVVIGFNVKNRDVSSVVKEIQDKLTKAKLLPTGYYFSYG